MNHQPYDSTRSSSSCSMYQQDKRNMVTILVNTLLLVLVLVLFETTDVDAFGTSSTFIMTKTQHGGATTILTTSTTTTTNLFMAKSKGGGKKKKRSKGFGTTPPPPPSEPLSEATASTTTTTTTTVVPSSSDNDNSSSSSSSSKVTTPMNAGQKALEKLRQERQNKKDDELRQLINLKEQDEVVRSNPDAAVIPERVATKMTQRMIPFVALPIVGSLGSFVVFWYLATFKNYEFQPAVVAITTIGFLALGLFGITYSMMSTPWDEDSLEAEGSLLGIDEFQTNISNLKEGLSRSRDNLKLREQMKGLPESEIQAAIRDLERRERKASNKGKTFEDKLKDEGL